MKNILVLSLVILALIGCTTVDSLHRDQAGTTQIFKNHSLVDVFEATAKVVSLKLNVLDMDRSKAVIKAESNANDSGFGEVIAVYVYELDNGNIALKVITQKKLRAQPKEKEWGSIITEAVVWELKN